MQAGTGDAALRLRPERRTAQKETHFIPKLNRMPDGQPSVKARTPNLQPGIASKVPGIPARLDE